MPIQISLIFKNLIINQKCFRFELADSPDDSKSLRVNLKYPGKAVFSVWPPEDERLNKVYGIPAANLSIARKAQQASKLNAIEHQYDSNQFYTQPPKQPSPVESTCRRRFDQLSLYSAYGFGIPEVMADFFDRNLGLFILLLTISVTITAVFGEFII